MTIEEMVDYIVNNIKNKPRTSYYYKNGIKIFNIYQRNEMAQKIVDLFNEDNYSQATKVIQDYLECDEETAKLVCMEFKIRIYDDIIPDCTNMTIEEIVDQIYNGKYDPYYQLSPLYKNNNDLQAAKIIQNYSKCDEATAKLVWEKYKTKAYESKLEDISPEQIAYNNAEAQRLLNVNQPKCPTCGSTNIKRISGTERAISVLGLGIFSNKINKSYKCGNCKCTW